MNTLNTPSLPPRTRQMEVQILPLFHVRLIFQNVAHICTYVCFLVQGSGFRPIFSPSHDCLNSGSSLYTYHKPKGGNLWLELSPVLTPCRQGLAQRTARAEERLLYPLYSQTHQSCTSLRGSWMRRWREARGISLVGTSASKETIGVGNRYLSLA